MITQTLQLFALLFMFAQEVLVFSQSKYFIT